MIDQTTTEFATESDYLQLFINLVETNQFNEDKSADIQVTPKSYIFATHLVAGVPSPMRIVVGDYTMRLHCQPNAKAHEHPVKEPTTAESDEN